MPLLHRVTSACNFGVFSAHSINVNVDGQAPLVCALCIFEILQKLESVDFNPFSDVRFGTRVQHLRDQHGNLRPECSEDGAKYLPLR